MKLDKMSVIELKALAYDHVAQIQRLRKDMVVINQAIMAKETKNEKEKNEPPTTTEPAGNKRRTKAKAEAGKT